MQFPVKRGGAREVIASEPAWIAMVWNGHTAVDLWRAVDITLAHNLGHTIHR